MDTPQQPILIQNMQVWAVALVILETEHQHSQNAFGLRLILALDQPWTSITITFSPCSDTENGDWRTQTFVRWGILPQEIAVERIPTSVMHRAVSAGDLVRQFERHGYLDHRKKMSRRK